ncbi:septum formation protein Maf [Candidatus Saganbacteria bacterium]|nr:septum formation protein Maf [Candidatus Saganbacteria bacterium]
MSKDKIILASASPRRKELLKKIVKNFKISVSRIDESKIKASTPLRFAIKAAITKAKDVASRNTDSIVIGADTIVVLGEKILGKPKDNKHAVAMLKALSGSTHKVITGIAVYNPKDGKIYSDYDITKIRVRKLKEKAILDYVKSGSPLDKAGGYGIQEIEDPFIERIEGNYDNVVGLPVARLKNLLCLVT